MGPFPHHTPKSTICARNPVGTDGFEFVEFCHPEPQILEKLFTRMGYSEVAKHRSKAVSVWRQGDINYLVNRESDSHAVRFADRHGPCAPSMAWRVVDAGDPRLLVARGVMQGQLHQAAIACPTMRLPRCSN